MNIDRPVRNAGPRVVARQSTFPLQCGRPSSGWKMARTRELMPSAPTSRSAPSVAVVSFAQSSNTTRTGEPGVSSNDCNRRPVTTASVPSRRRTASSSVICNRPR